MALDEQVIGSLDSYQPNPALASGASAVMPFNPQISEQVLGQLASITNNAIKKRENDFKTWETNLAREYSNLKVASDVYDADRELIAKERKNAFGNIAKNSIYLAPAYQLKNPEKYNEVMSNGQSYLEKVQMSKDDKLFEKSIIDMMKKDSSYDNVVNQKRLEKFRNSPLGERERFVAVADPSMDITKQTKNIREQVKGDLNVKNYTDPVSQRTSTIFEYDVPDDTWISVLSSYTDPYYRAYFNENATDEERALGYDQWSRNKLLSFKPKNITEKTTVGASESYKQEQQNARTDKTIEGRKDVAEMNNATKEKIAKYNAEVKANPEFDKVNTAIEMIDGLKNNVEFSLDPSGLAMLNKYSNSNYTKAQKLNSANIPPDLIPKIFKGGKTEYGEAYGSLFYVEDAEGNGKFVTGKPEYLVERGKQVTKKQYAESTAKDKRVNIVPDMKPGHIYTTDELAKQIATSTEKGKAQWNRYEAGMPKTEVTQSKTKGVFDMFYTPYGITINNGVRRNGAMYDAKDAKDHNDHIHLEFDDPKDAKEIISLAKDWGLSTRGNPMADSNTHSTTTKKGNTSAHSMKFDDGTGKAVDIGHSLRSDYKGKETLEQLRLRFAKYIDDKYYGGQNSQQDKSTSQPKESTQKKSTTSKKVWTGKFDSKGKMIYK